MQIKYENYLNNLKKYDVIINTVNCVGVMGKGLALEFKKMYPEMFKQYQQDCKNKILDIGKPTIYRINNNQILINIPTKLHWKDDSKYEYIIKALNWLYSYLKQYEDNSLSIGIPALGCSNGGLNFEIVKNLIKMKLSNINQNIDIYAPLGYKLIKNNSRHINRFRGDYKFLSNFYESSFIENNIEYKSVEHYYQAHKATNREDFNKIRNAATASLAKKLGRTIEKDKEFNFKRVDIMQKAISLKFSQNLEIRTKLLTLSNQGYSFTEGNYWHDNFWGRCTCNKCKDKLKLNILGLLLKDFAMREATLKKKYYCR